MSGWFRCLLAKHQCCVADANSASGSKHHRLVDRHPVYSGSIGAAPIKDLPLIAIPADVTMVTRRAMIADDEVTARGAAHRQEGLPVRVQGIGMTCLWSVQCD